jgi:hypothetical protein
LRSMKSRAEVDPSNFRVVLRATGSDELYRQMLGEFGIGDIVELAPSIDYRSALHEMMCADGLLLFQAAMCNHQIPAKLYEYFRAGRPMFALTDPFGNTAETLRGAGAQDIVNIADSRDIELGLKRFLTGVRAKTILGVEPAIARLHSRRSRTAELAGLIDHLIKAP